MNQTVSVKHAVFFFLMIKLEKKNLGMFLKVVLG